MSLLVETRANNYTQWFEVTDGNAEQVFRCECGKTHRGPYAIYPYMRHGCEHGSPLEECPWDAEALWCPECAQMFCLEAS